MVASGTRMTVAGASDGRGAIAALEAAWLAGDVKALRRLSNDRMRKEAPELFKALIMQRAAPSNSSAQRQPRRTATRARRA